MKVTFDRLRTLKAECDAIVMQQALGFMADRKLSDLGTLAMDRIKYEKTLMEVIESKGEVIGRIMRGESTIEKETANPAYKKLVQVESSEWQKEANQFEFEPVTVSAKDVLVDRFSKEAVTVPMFGYNHGILPYSSFHALIQEGFITITD